ncbi:hypothetical protein B1219_06810 [Pseudomonas ogarae]|nr:hypothetical protein B1219_06810 [Pseudomonas ogarae]OPG77000.1 hypothetical protein B1218_23075 [Pseudomonas ogarae]
MWRGSLLPLGREAALEPRSHRSGPGFGAASQPSGSKLPRHKGMGSSQKRCSRKKSFSPLKVTPNIASRHFFSPFLNLLGFMCSSYHLRICAAAKVPLNCHH